MNPLTDFSLTGRVALVTGAGRGIGAAIARAFAAAGAAVALVARTQADIEAVAAEIEANAREAGIPPSSEPVRGPSRGASPGAAGAESGKREATGRRAVALPADVKDLTRLPGLVERTVGQLGGLDIVVNNAGGEITPPFLETRVEHLEAAFHFNVSVPFELSRLAVPHLLARPGASIINMSSIVVGKSVRAHLAHHTGKAAEAQLTRSMAADLGPRIRVNAILPGAVETEALRDYMDARDPDLRDALIANTRLRRIATPEDIAHAAVYLASPAASWVTGLLLELDGGAVDETRPMFPDL
ncbi:MAG: SDR family oxidoreductase [Actinobacteria bacterium]|nr:MAG: SDR family oxidoreductase [Actinomycetota bacterium]